MGSSFRLQLRSSAESQACPGLKITATRPVSRGLCPLSRAVRASLLCVPVFRLKEARMWLIQTCEEAERV